MTSALPLARRLNAPDPSGAAERSRQLLLQAGIACFAELGYQGASTRLIENAAGLTRNLITHHWGSKAEFWKACIDHLLGAFIAEVAQAEQQAVNVNGVERLRFTIRAYIRACAKFPEVQRIMLEEGKRDEERLQWLAGKYGQPMKHRVAQLLREAETLGVAPRLPVPSIYYTLIGAASMFAMASECRLLFDEDPLSEAAIASHADAVARLLIGDLSPSSPLSVGGSS